MTSILQVDITGTPQHWLSPKEAANLVCTDDVAWTYGSTAAVLHGGFSRALQKQSRLEIPAILGTRGQSRVNVQDAIPPLTSSNRKLFERDRYTCAYCGMQGMPHELNREHIQPVSRGGANTWMNVVTACRSCNGHKGNRTLEEAGISLLYVPYKPNLFEDFILRQGVRRILADQMEFLLARVSPNSRIRELLD